MWVIFEGLDKTGKTTLEWEFLKATNFKHIIIDRGPAGYLVFDRILKRATKEGNKNFIKQAKQIADNKDALVVYCFANEDVVNERLAAHNEKQLQSGYDYNFMQKVYFSNVKHLYNPERTLLLDTSYKTIEECIQLILEQIRRMTLNDELHECK